VQNYRSGLPQLSGDVFLTDAGVETDLIFNHGIEIREFAAFTLLPIPQGRAALTRYFEGFLDLAKERNTGFILDSTTWKAHAHWAKSLGADTEELRADQLREPHAAIAYHGRLAIGATNLDRISRHGALGGARAGHTSTRVSV